MIIKESEANFKMCPMIALDHPEAKMVGCYGKECMAWRWYSSILKYGYCGLAGKVESSEVEPAVEKKP